MTVLRKHLTLLRNQVMNTGIGVETQAFIMLAVEYSNNFLLTWSKKVGTHLVEDPCMVKWLL